MGFCWRFKRLLWIFLSSKEKKKSLTTRILQRLQRAKQPCFDDYLNQIAIAAIVPIIFRPQFFKSRAAHRSKQALFFFSVRLNTLMHASFHIVLDILLGTPKLLLIVNDFGGFFNYFRLNHLIFKLEITN